MKKKRVQLTPGTSSTLVESVKNVEDSALIRRASKVKSFARSFHVKDVEKVKNVEKVEKVSPPSWFSVLLNGAKHLRLNAPWQEIPWQARKDRGKSGRQTYVL